MFPACVEGGYYICYFIRPSVAEIKRERWGRERGVEIREEKREGERRGEGREETETV